MRLDHIAYRVSDRHATAKFFQEALKYHIQQEFTIDFGDEQTAQCIALEPPEKVCSNLPWIWEGWETPPFGGANTLHTADYHMAPELFVSDGSPNSIVYDWVAKRDGIGGIHHIAYQVESVEATMKLWKEKGYAEFTSEEPMRCDNLIQIFSKPSALTGVVYEFIQRGEFGFCKENVKSLMLSSKE